MDYADIVSITGLSGLYKVATQRKDGMIVTSLTDNNTKFVSARQHNFTFLENVSIYTEDNNVKELKEVLQMMLKKEKTTPPPDPKADAHELNSYFAEIMPEYDRERVYNSDIQKIIKWYNILKSHDLLKEKEEKEEKAPGEIRKEEKAKKEKSSLKAKEIPGKPSAGKAASKKTAGKKASEAKKPIVTKRKKS